MTEPRNDGQRAEHDPKFKKVVGNLLRTPPKPHKDEEPKRPAKAQQRGEK